MMGDGITRPRGRGAQTMLRGTVFRSYNRQNYDDTTSASCYFCSAACR